MPERGNAMVPNHATPASEMDTNVILAFETGVSMSQTGKSLSRIPWTTVLLRTA